VAKPTKTQIDFAKVMTIKQRGVLNSLVMFDCYMSASEIADEELRDIVRHLPATPCSPASMAACHGAPRMSDGSSRA